jgi:hypothetical protein
MPAHFPGLAQVHQQKMLDIGSWDFMYIYTCLLTLRIGECPSKPGRWAGMYLCVMIIDIASFYDIDIWFLN